MVALYLEQWEDRLNNSSTLMHMHIISLNTHDGPVDKISPTVSVYFVILNYYQFLLDLLG